MPRFQFEALDISGKSSTGVLVARNADQLASTLRDKGLFVIRFRQVSTARAVATNPFLWSIAVTLTFTGVEVIRGDLSILAAIVIFGVALLATACIVLICRFMGVTPRGAVWGTIAGLALGLFAGDAILQLPRDLSEESRELRRTPWRLAGPGVGVVAGIVSAAFIQHLLRARKKL